MLIEPFPHEDDAVAAVFFELGQQLVQPDQHRRTSGADRAQGPVDTVGSFASASW